MIYILEMIRELRRRERGSEGGGSACMNKWVIVCLEF